MQNHTRELLKEALIRRLAQSVGSLGKAFTGRVSDVASSQYGKKISSLKPNKLDLVPDRRVAAALSDRKRNITALQRTRKLNDKIHASEPGSKIAESWRGKIDSELAARKQQGQSLVNKQLESYKKAQIARNSKLRNRAYLAAGAAGAVGLSAAGVADNQRGNIHGI